MWDNTLPKNRFLRFCVLMAHRCGRHNVAMQSAALAFYLLFMIFPFLIFISALLGLLDLNITGMMTVLSDFLPEEVVDLLRMYFTYVTDNPSPRLMVFGLVFSIYFPMRATNSLMAAVRTAYHLGPPKGFITQWTRRQREQNAGTDIFQGLDGILGQGIEQEQCQKADGPGYGESQRYPQLRQKFRQMKMLHGVPQRPLSEGHQRQGQGDGDNEGHGIEQHLDPLGDNAFWRA